MKAIAKALVLSACVLALTACGGDDSDDGNAGAGAGGSSGSGSGGTSGSGSGGTSGTGGTSGASGTGGTGGTGGSTGGAGGTMAAPVVCGGVTCDAPSNARLRSCCVEGTDECGEKFPGGFIMSTCTVPATPDDECEGIMLMGFNVPGCCTPEGRCGIGAGPIFGESCTSIEDLQALAAGDGGVDDGGVADGGAADGGMSQFPDAPEPKACTP